MYAIYRWFPDFDQTRHIDNQPTEAEALALIFELWREEEEVEGATTPQLWAVSDHAGRPCLNVLRHDTDPALAIVTSFTGLVELWRVRDQASPTPVDARLLLAHPDQAPAGACDSETASFENGRPIK